MWKRMWPLLVLVAVVCGGYLGFSAYLRSEDISWNGYLSGLMLNVWGGERNQLIRVNLHNHFIALYQNGELIEFDRIAATGNPDDYTATPTGRFRILSKDAWHLSGAYIMPLALRFYKGYYFHDIPLYRADESTVKSRYSHGCIRLPHELAEQVFEWANVGAYVEIYDASLARADGSDTVYRLLADGSRVPIANEAEFNARGYRWQDVAVLPAPELEGLVIYQ